MRDRRKRSFEERGYKKDTSTNPLSFNISPKNYSQLFNFLFHITRRGFSRNQLGSGSILTFFLSFLHDFFRSISLRLSSLMRSLIGLLHHRILERRFGRSSSCPLANLSRPPRCFLFNLRDFQLPIVSLYEEEP